MLIEEGMLVTTESGDTDTSAARRRKLMMVAREWGLTDEERYELSSFLLRRDVRSWKSLTDGQVSRLLDGFEVAELLMELMRQRS